MPNISVTVSEHEQTQIENYAKLLGASISDTIKTVFFDRLEDDFDIKLIQEYEAEPDKITYSHEEVKSMLGL